jgi:hypothetical protein
MYIPKRWREARYVLMEGAPSAEAVSFFDPSAAPCDGVLEEVMEMVEVVGREAALAGDRLGDERLAGEVP